MLTTTMRRSLLGVWTSLTFLLLIHVSVPLSAFQPTSSTSSSLSSQRCSSLLVAVLQHKQQRAAVVALRAAEPSSAVDEQELAYLKQELSDYLELRKEVGADTLAKNEIGKVVGGTKGNLILEYVSAAPNKATVTEEPPNPLDYDELTKYGYGRLVTRIMNAGGRLKMYDLLDLTPPPARPKKIKNFAPPIVIDRLGEQTRYRGLKLGQALNDDVQGAALQDYQRKIEQGERPASSKVREEVEAFELPFADKRNVGPKQTPDWTVERLDEWGRQQGRVESWARKARQGAFVQDPMESFDSLRPQQRAYSIVTGLTAAAAFGKATPAFIGLITSGGGGDVVVDPNLLAVLQFPSAALVLASLGSSAYCALTAASKNRSQYVWAVKGLIGGPLTAHQLASLSTLVTQQEQDDRDKQIQQNLVK